MTDSFSPAPAFGQADLTNCEREQIQFAGSIQPHGALLVVAEDDFRIIQASANASAFLGLRGAAQGRSLAEISPDLHERLQAHLGPGIAQVPVGIRFSIGAGGALFDATIHRPPAGGLVVEIERAGESIDLAGDIEPLLQRVVVSPTLRAHCDETARVVRELTGYDRVMVYRFDKQGHGEVLSEDRRPDLESYLGNWYPASDIPQIARRLYVRNRIRVLVDVTYSPVPLEPRLSPLTGEELDMSLCILRSSSPIHVQYLQNMGVAATLVISLMVHGRLWGLIACHHYGPKTVAFECRAVCEVLAEAVATRIAALETFAQARTEMSARRLEQRMIESISREGEWRNALFENPQTLLQALRASGAALIYDGQVVSTGEAPSTQDIRAIAGWIRDNEKSAVFASARFTSEAPDFAHLTPIAAGIAARRVSNSGEDWILWFRPERIRTVTWGGDPSKPVEIGNSPADLSPRRSFAQWHQLVVGTSEDWTADDIASTRLISDVVADVALQHQSVRSLIIQDQIRQVNRTISVSEHPVATADARGELVYVNASFERLLGRERPRRIGDLARLVTRPDGVADRLRELLESHRSWRGEVWMADANGAQTPLLLRADPVIAPGERVLGYVLLFTDLAEIKAAETARRRFQEGLVDSHAMKHARLDSEADLVYRRLLSSIVENAQVAALEIAESEHVATIPAMLDSVRDSVARSAEVLETLVSHAMRAIAASAGEKKKPAGALRRRAPPARKPASPRKPKY